MLNVGCLLLWAQRGRMGVSMDSQVTYVITVCDSSPVPNHFFPASVSPLAQLAPRTDQIEAGGARLAAEQQRAQPALRHAGTEVTVAPKVGRHPATERRTRPVARSTMSLIFSWCLLTRHTPVRVEERLSLAT